MQKKEGQVEGMLVPLVWDLVPSEQLVKVEKAFEVAEDGRLDVVAM